MKIPKRITVGGMEYDVRRPQQMKQPHSRGQLVRHSPEGHFLDVAVQENIKGRTLTEKEVTHTFWHEGLHAALHSMDHKLATNEAFVDALAKRLTQIIYSAKF